jgi:hypothetical protein
VLSSAEIRAVFLVTYSNEEVDEFVVKTSKGVLKFSQILKNLYMHKPVIKKTNQDVNLLSAVKENKMHFTDRQFARAKAAINLSRALGCPSDADLKAILWLNLINDCPVVQTNLNLAEKIFGKDVAVLKGKSGRSKPKQVIHDTIEMPRALKKAQSQVTLCINTF